VNTAGSPHRLASASYRILTLSSRMETDTGRPTRIGMLAPNGASPFQVLRRNDSEH
jgi:hypothetical protein